MFDSTIVGGGARRILEYTKAHEWAAHNPLTKAGWKIIGMTAFFLLVLWSLFMIAPLPATVAERFDIPFPEIRIHRGKAPSPYNASKVAFLMEDRPIPHLAPLLLHMISVVPPDWRFLFMGSEESIAFLNTSLPVQMHEANGKLDMEQIPENWTVKGQEELSVTMTSTEFWEHIGGRSQWDWRNPWLDRAKTRSQVEWMLIFQTDSIMCANSKVSLNKWLDYDWVGAPWNINDRFGGNGGLSIRRLSSILKVLKFQERHSGTELEDLWLIQRIGHLPGAKMANGTVESQFSVEQVWQDEPMGYHTGWSGERLPEAVWDSSEHRKHIWDYCPEIKMILPMKLKNEGCGDDGDEEGHEKRMVEDWPRLKAW